MGCASSTPQVPVGAPEPTPTFDELCKQEVATDPKEPRVWSKKDLDNVKNADGATYPDNNNETLSLIYRKIATSNKGDTFQLENLNDQLFYGIQMSPAVRGVNVKKRLENLVYVHHETDTGRPLCYAVKNVSRGLNYYVLLSTRPVFEGQQPSEIQSPFGDCYTWAGVEFDIKTKIGRIKTVYHPKSQQPRPEDPRYTFYQCNPNVWVIKKLDKTICGAINQWKGMAKLTCYRLVVCKGEDPIFVGLVAHCIDSFLEVAKTQGKLRHYCRVEARV